jgi:arabinan endo-1,5-alpha-L-arabinosidase
VGPVWSGYFADPFVLHVDGEYFAYGTGGPAASDTAAGARFPMLRSPDAARWTPAGFALREPRALSGRSFWAPEVAVRNGIFHLFYSAGGPEGEGHRLRVARARSPLGEFEDAGVEVVPDEPFSIDPHPFLDPRDGRWYLFFVKDFFDEPVGSGISVAPLADDFASLLEPPRVALRPSAAWHVYARDRHWYGRTWRVWHTVEGPCVVHRQGLYWLFYSGGLWKSADYGVSVATSESVLGPYEERDTGSGAKVLRPDGLRAGPGHNSITSRPDGGGDLIAYHAWDPSFTARRMHVDALDWTPEGPQAAPWRPGPTGSQSRAD